MREFYCIRCRNLHTADSRMDSLRILSTGYHIVGEQRYQICICNSPEWDIEAVKPHEFNLKPHY